MEDTRRSRAVEQVMATMRLEGFEFDARDMDRFDRLVRGEATPEDLLRETDEEVTRWRIEHPEWFASEAD